MDDLVLNNLNIAYKITNDFFKTCDLIEYEDLRQIALLGLVKAARTYKKETGYEFCTYAYKVINNEIGMELRKINKRKETCSINDFITENLTNGDTLSSDEDIEDQVMYDGKTIYEYMRCLSSIELQVMQLVIKGCNQVDIGNKLGIAQGSVSRIKDRAIKKMGGINKYE